MVDKIDKCPYCSSTRTVWRGYRYNEATKRHLRLCKKCNRKYTPNDNFLRMRFKKDTIMKGVNLYGKGLSLSEVQHEMKHRYDVKVSRWTILKWFKKYTKK
ncbi:MAG: hypothetical protein KKB03_02960 [Nanoarchaeota archaeon]|nr:hypothetical protein [Nanoarchaeota archaeon]MBU1135017.1 hypothetical protein [Nanoarchaeota archaeon]MBU2520175.1 hypothetical protein [Nanoarchaeota archaeon]